MFAKTWASRCAIWFSAALLFGICVMAFAAAPSTRLSGSILDARGKPLAGVPVGILLSKQVEVLRKARPKLALATRTDASGSFQLSLPQSLGQVTLVTPRSGLRSGQALARRAAARASAAAPASGVDAQRTCQR